MATLRLSERGENPMANEDLLPRFVAAFGTLGEAVLLEPGALPPELIVGGQENSQENSPRTRAIWKPAPIRTDPTALVELYEKLPGRFPLLYERLALSYRWLEVDLVGFMTLWSNPPGPSLSLLLANITGDPVFVEVLFPLGFLPFGKASGGSYDPVCFDLHRRNADGDCPVVRVEHEAVLCDGRIGDRWELADSFRTLVKVVVAKAAIRGN